jgi:hypothetical protein
MSKNTKPSYNWRSSVTGEYVKASVAKNSPATHEKEKRKRVK